MFMQLTNTLCVDTMRRAVLALLVDERGLLTVFFL